jgi:hypothetical protein
LADFFIREMNQNDMNAVLDIYETARDFMRRSGNPNQWGDTRPTLDEIEKHIGAKNAYVCVSHENEIACVFTFYIGKDPLYARIYYGTWLNDTSPYGVVHGIASSGRIKGAVTFCLEYCYSKCGNIRIDTHRDNKRMRRLLDFLGYTYCGVIYFSDGSERLTYQKCAIGEIS